MRVGATAAFASIAIACAADQEDPDVACALYACGQPTPAAAILHLRSGKVVARINGTDATMEIVDQGRGYPSGTCTAWPMGFFQAPGATSYRIECDRHAPFALALEMTGPDPRSLSGGDNRGSGLTARIATPCNQPGDPCTKCDLDVADARFLLVASDVVGSSAPDPKMVTPDYHRAWSVVVDVPTRTAPRGTGLCRDVAFTVTMTIEQSAADYRWVPSRAQMCGE